MASIQSQLLALAAADPASSLIHSVTPGGGGVRLINNPWEAGGLVYDIGDRRTIAPRVGEILQAHAAAQAGNVQAVYGLEGAKLGLAGQEAIADSNLEAARVRADAELEAALAQIGSTDTARANQLEFARDIVGSVGGLLGASNQGGTTDILNYVAADRDLGRQILAPFSFMGQLGMTGLFGGLPSEQELAQSLTNNPAVQAQIDLGTEAINRSAAAQGLTGSGRTLRELQQYGQQVASNQMDNIFARAQGRLQPYEAIANLGTNAAIAAAGGQTGLQQSLIGLQGQSQAAATSGGLGLLGSAIASTRV